jgi:hypothetical protein
MLVAYMKRQLFSGTHRATCSRILEEMERPLREAAAALLPPQEA